MNPFCLAVWLCCLLPSWVCSFGLPCTSSYRHNLNTSLLQLQRRHQLPPLQTSSDGSSPPQPPINQWRGGGDGAGDDSDDDTHQHIAVLAAALTSRAEADSTPSTVIAQRMRGGYATRRRPRSNMPKASVTNVLLAITAAIYGAQWLVPGITMQGAKITSKIMRGQWYRLVTPIFLHANLAHLLMNSMSLYNIGPFVEQWFGKRRMLSIYVLSGVSGVLASCYWNPRASSVGASGAIFGMVGAAACFFASNRNELGAGADRGLQSILRTVVINTIMGLQISQIDNAGHAGGFVAGFVLTYLFGPNMRWVGSPYSGPRLVDVPRVSLAGMQGDLSRFRRRLSGRQ